MSTTTMGLMPFPSGWSRNGSPTPRRLPRGRPDTVAISDQPEYRSALMPVTPIDEATWASVASGAVDADFAVGSIAGTGTVVASAGGGGAGRPGGGCLS